MSLTRLKSLPTGPSLRHSDGDFTSSLSFFFALRWLIKPCNLICLIYLLVNKCTGCEIDDMTEATNADMLNRREIWDGLLKNANHLIITAMIIANKGPNTAVRNVVIPKNT